MMVDVNSRSIKPHAYDMPLTRSKLDCCFLNKAQA